MQILMKQTIRNALVATVACGLMVSACASKDAKMQQPRADMSGLRAPAKNPGMKAAAAAEMKADELVQVVEPQAAVESANEEEVELVSSHAAYQPVPEQKKSWFDWGSSSEPAVAPQPQGERKVPVLNAEPVEGVMAAAPADVVTEEVIMAQQPVAVNPSSNVIVAEEVAMFQDVYTPSAAPEAQPVNPQYPNLASVPLRPERLDAVQEADAKMVQLQQEQHQNMQQAAALEQQVAADAGESLLPAKPVVDPEFASIVGANQNNAGLQHGKEVVIIEQAQPVDYAAQAPVSYEAVENVQAEVPVAAPQAVTAPVVASVAPVVPAQPVIVEEEVVTQAPLAQDVVAPQAPVVASAAPVAAPQAEEWVSLQADPAQQMAQPIEQVDVMQTPDVAYVSDAVAPQAIALTPPSISVREQRVLPDSRYAARRQAVYAQRYNRVQLVDGK